MAARSAPLIVGAASGPGQWPGSQSDGWCVV